MPVITPETYFSSDNPIIQKCFDILKDEDVKIKSTGVILYVYKGGSCKYSVGSCGLLWIGDIMFDADKRYDGMSFEDVYKLSTRCQYLYSLGDHERVQKALKQLGIQLKQDSKLDSQSKKESQTEPQQSLALFERIRNGFRKIFTPSKNK